MYIVKREPFKTDAINFNKRIWFFESPLPSFKNYNAWVLRGVHFMYKYSKEIVDGLDISPVSYYIRCTSIVYLTYINTESDACLFKFMSLDKIVYSLGT